MKGGDRVKVLALVYESLADRAMEAKRVQEATQGANTLANMQESEDFDGYDEDQDSQCDTQEVDNDIHASAEGNGEYGGSTRVIRTT